VASDHAAALDPEELRAALARLTSDRVEVRETHISWVFLAAERAYKLKKPLVLPFLDYGTPARRRAMCAEEVRLNKRLAEEIYLCVRGIAQAASGPELTDESDPKAVDYVVEMQRYDEERTLKSTLGRGELTRPDVTAVARRLAAFHARCPSALVRERGARRIELEVGENLEELLGVGELRAERERIHALARFIAAFLSSRSDVFDRRAEQGLTRECHGDLRAEHVVLGRPVSIVDCVEFDAGLRTLDVADDLAFLMMDLTALGGERFGAQLVDDYRSAGGECGEDALLAFFAVHRALVRAKVLLVRAGQHPARSAAHGHAEAQARELLAVAEQFAWRARLPLVIVVCGVPASGKSHLAQGIAGVSRLQLLSSDLLRKRLAGIEPTATAAPDRYSAEFSRATYAELGSRAAAEATARGGALIDATFRRRGDRDAFVGAFSDATPLLFVECLAPAAVLARRAVQRERDPSRVSDATLPVVLRERESWEPLDEIPGDRHVILRTDRPLESIMADLIALLDQRLSERRGGIA
jgi:uncharacterized protein